MNKRWKNFVTSGRDIGAEDADYRKLYLTNTLLLTAALIFGLFASLTFFVTEQYLITLVDLCGMYAALFTILYLRRGYRLFVGSAVLVGLVFVLTLISIYFDTYPNMNLAWVYVIPLTAIFLLGRKWGVWVVLLYTLFYSGILLLKTDGIEIVNKGPIHFANVLGVLAAVTVLARYFEVSRQEAHGSLNQALEREARQTKKLTSALDELNSYKHDLEIKVAETVNELREKDKLLIQQSKMASMGEMIAIIAHQLKQPINAISLVTQDAKEAYRSNEMNEEYINELSRKMMGSILYMSETIDDFKNFLNPNKKREFFSLKESIRKGLDIIAPQLRGDDVEVLLLGDDVRVSGVSGEIQQMVINLVINAKEAMKVRHIKKRAVRIEISHDESHAEIVVGDNGGGIDEAVVHSLFDSYVTTKEDGGTGLGLYMVKLIAQSMQGCVDVRNNNEGAEFRITLPLEQA